MQRLTDSAKRLLIAIRTLKAHRIKRSKDEIKNEIESPSS